jgi:hypothetical protein
MRHSITIGAVTSLVLLLASPGGVSAQTTPPIRRLSDSAFAVLQERGRLAMGVDQYSSTHRFDDLPDGGRIELQRNADDPVGVAAIRAHLRDIEGLFRAGDFRIPAMVHDMVVPGTEVMAARRDKLRYVFTEMPRGGELRIVTTDPAAREAVHAFLAFQRMDHRAHGMKHIP